MVRSLALPVVLLFAPAAFAQSPGVHSPGAGEHAASPSIAIHDVAPDAERVHADGRWLLFLRDET